MDQAQSNIEVVEAALEAIQNGDLKGAMARFEEEIRWGVAEWLPQAGLHDGHDAVQQMLGAVRERFPGGYKLLGLTAYGTKDHVFVETTRAAGDHPHREGAEHVLLAFHVVMGKIRDVREFAYSIR
ncbi:MAG: nuclear transport factor 2 family protein [Myxococcales bacterium]|nr:nuclear transport factor 2 family protein [Myxococcales bacterium]